MMSYNNYKNFEQAEHYPEMIGWLLESFEALSNLEIWGFQQKTYQWSYLQDYFAHDRNPREESEKGSDTKKINTRKAHRKAKKEKKDKGKAKAKARERFTEEKSESSNDVPHKKSGSSCKK